MSAPTFTIDYTEPRSRVTEISRPIWLIPTLIVAIFVLVVAVVFTVLSWFAILVTGRQPRALFDYLAKTHAFMVHVTACGLLMSDVRPKFRS